MRHESPLLVLSRIGPDDYSRMDHEDVALAIAEVLRRNGLAAPEIGECGRPAMKKVLSGLLSLEADAASAMAEVLDTENSDDEGELD